jgi:hypothetical protein
VFEIVIHRRSRAKPKLDPFLRCRLNTPLVALGVRHSILGICQRTGGGGRAVQNGDSDGFHVGDNTDSDAWSGNPVSLWRKTAGFQCGRTAGFDSGDPGGNTCYPESLRTRIRGKQTREAQCASRERHSALRRAAALAPGSEAVWNLAMNLWGQDMPREAPDLLLTLGGQRRWKQDTEYWTRLGGAFQRLGEYEWALH